MQLLMERVISVLSNDQLSMTDNFVAWVNVFGAVLALYCNYWASSKGLISMRRTHFLISGLASLYVSAYLILLISDIQFIQWSSVMLGISIIVWPIVWIIPALLSIQVWKRVSELISTENLTELLENEETQPKLSHLFKDEEE